MVSSSKMSPRASLSILLLLLAGSAVAVRTSLNSRMHATHRVREVAPGVHLTSFHPENTFEVSTSISKSDPKADIVCCQTFGAGIDVPLSKRDNPASTEETAVAFIKSQLGITDDDIASKSSFDGEVSKHAFFSQVVVRNFDSEYYCLIVLTAHRMESLWPTL